MIFTETILGGALIIELKRFEDERGYFAQSFTQSQFAGHGLNPRVAECNTSFNIKKGTLRGMHFQLPPRAQAKLVRCTAGSIYDLAIDLRLDSPTFMRWVGVELTARNGLMFYVPEGFAHGYLTLEDDTEVSYQVSDVYAPELSGGVRWNDPAFGITLPAEVEVINERDNTYPDFLSR
ncbi:MAG: dTDP-4-dehydrorhamnose 3,5-epimerase [Pyrinomonadaceae bacterium]